MKLSLLFYTYIFSFFYILFLSILYFSKSRLDNNENSIYKRLLITNFFGVITQILCEVFSILGIELLNIIFTKLLLVYFSLWIIQFFSYVLEISNYNNKTLKIINSIIFVVSIVLIFTLPYKAYIDNVNGVYYTYGLDTKYTYFISILYITTISAVSIAKHRVISSKKAIPIYILVACFIISGLIQYSKPEITIIVQIETFICMIMYFTIENPDMKMVEQLEVARRQADQANKSKTDFLSSMSHEIRTPLNAIVGFSSEILEAKDLNEAQTNAKDIVNASDTLLEIVNGILDISKIEAGKLEIVNSTYDAMETFEELGKLITPKMTEKGLEFNVSISSNLPNTLYGDHANIKKIVTNLLSNACKYTDSGHVNYDVKCVNNDETCHLTITVEDSGRGMKEEAMQQLFNKFQRLDEVRNSAIEGTGLGLAITKQLVELMGGKISVNSTYGQGSRFVVELDQKIEFGEIVKKEEVKDTLDLHDISILLVDDTPLNLKVASKLLERYGANKIETCDSGFACIEKIQQGAHYDVILLDDMMPKMSGVETFGKLKALSTFHTPTIVLTANAISGMREKYLAEGFDGYLAKPIEKAQLITVMNEVLGNKVVKSDNQVDNSNVEMITINDSKPATNTSQDEAKIEIVDENKKPEENKIEIIDEKKTDSVESLDEKGDENKMDNNENVTQQPSVEQPVVNETTPVVESVTPTEDAIAKTQMITITSDAPKQPQEGMITITDVQPVQQEETPQVAEAASTEAATPEATPTETSAPQASGTYDRSYLEGQGVDMNHALELLGDMEMYNDTIKDFYSEVEEKWNNIVNYKNENNMPEYAILVHSLKSDCKYLGFMKLADVAYDHELKSKDNDSAYINEHFKELEDEYQKILAIVKEYVAHNS